MIESQSRLQWQSTLVRKQLVGYLLCQPLSRGNATDGKRGSIQLFWGHGVYTRPSGTPSSDGCMRQDSDSDPSFAVHRSRIDIVGFITVATRKRSQGNRNFARGDGTPCGKQPSRYVRKGTFSIKLDPVECIVDSGVDSPTLPPLIERAHKGNSRSHETFGTCVFRVFETFCCTGKS